MSLLAFLKRRREAFPYVHGLSDKEGHHKGGKKAPNTGKGSEMDGICNKICVAGVNNGNGQATGNSRGE